MAQDRLDHLHDVISNDVEQGLYYGMAVKITRGGKDIFHEAIGYQDEEKARPLAKDSVFSIFSITKAFINILVLRSIELGRFALTTPVNEIIPEFSGAPRNRALVLHLLTHTSGLPGLWEVRPGMLIDRLDELLQAVCEGMHGIVEPGTRCDYSPVANHVLMAEILRRTDPGKRAITQILDEDLFRPLGMNDTALGVRKDLAARHVIPAMRGTLPVRVPGRTKPGDYAMFEEEFCEAPHVGCVSSVGSLSRFVEMLRGEGTLEGVRILSPQTVRMARRNWTGDMPNELYRVVALRAGYEVPPAYIGFGFNVRGTRIVHHQLGTLTSPETFGNYGAGTGVFWVDPELDVTFTALSVGAMTQAANIDRYQRLSDIVAGATD